MQALGETSMAKMQGETQAQNSPLHAGKVLGHARQVIGIDQRAQPRSRWLGTPGSPFGGLRSADLRCGHDTIAIFHSAGHDFRPLQFEGFHGTCCPWMLGHESEF